MINLIIAALIALGIISTPADFENASDSQKQQMTEIVIIDILEV